MDTVISIENVSKYYQLGSIGNRTLYQDLNRWWARMRGRSDPLQKIGDADHGNRDGEYIWALRDVSLKVQQGEVIGIIGRNGAGKSTLLKILSQVTAPTMGQIKIKGRIASLLEVGTGFHPELTGRENIYLNGAILGMSKAEIKKNFDGIVDFSEIEKFLDTPVKRYSSGMYVRLAFAVAAHLEPEILVIDEVLAVGDVQFQKKCLGKMEEVGRGGRTVLFVSHNMDAISTVCSKLMVLANGKTDFLGDVEEGINHYMSTSDDCRGYANLERAKSDLWPQPRRFAKLISISTMTKDLVTESFFKMGDTILIEVELNILDLVNSIEIGLFFQGFHGDFNCIALSSSEGFKDFILGRQKIRIEIPNINLIAGDYSLGVIISKQGEADDAKEKALNISIISANFTGYHAAFEYERYKHFRMLIRSKWMTIN